MKAEEVLARELAFPKLITSLIPTLVTSLGLAHTKVTKEVVAQALVTQAATKVPGPDKNNFPNLTDDIWVG